ncbi:MAG TPA: sigma-70 family RNA polymerase sigma factor [Clostridia bacterium]|nr:sigma-70 family RNA polymerase sigma factor [Clostridia bacterium]
MNVHFTYKLSKTPDVDAIINHQIEKLRKRLQVFKPDMISLHGSLGESPKKGFVAALNLRLPSGQMASNEAADSVQAALKASFDNILEQLSKHKDHLRAQHQWPRARRVENTRTVPQVPFEETLAAVHPEAASETDVTEFVNANIGRLRRFIGRELRFRLSNGQFRADQVTPDEVIDEAIATALDERTERPDKIALEPWLYRMARQAIDRIAQQLNADERSVPLESGGRDSDNADETLAEYNRDDMVLTNENLIPDPRTATPEEVVANEEIIGMVETALRRTRNEDREAFILFTFEGFTVSEIASITDRPVDDVRTSIQHAREHLRKSFPVEDPLKDSIMERSSRIA